MTLKGGGDIIDKDKIEVRCKGIRKDGQPCNRMFFVGSPGFDIFGKPKKQVVKCPSCRNYMLVRSEIEEKLVVEMIDKKAYEIEKRVIVEALNMEVKK